MPLTLAGRHVVPGNGVAPSLSDIAIALSRMPRFAGHTRRWWSVLDHTLFGYELTVADKWTPNAQLAWLLHDAHEAVTGDVPTDVKGADLRRTQEMLDWVIYGTYYRQSTVDELALYRDGVKKIDKRCLVAEAHVVGPDLEKTVIDSVFGPGSNSSRDIVFLRHFLGLRWNQLEAGRKPYLGVPPLELDQKDHPAVRKYLELVTDRL